MTHFLVYRPWYYGWLVAILWLSGCRPVIAPATRVAATPGPTPTSTAAVPDTGTLIQVDERKLFLACIGEKKPTVILEAGLGADHSSWALVQFAVADFARVCSYDRAGLGQSEPATSPRTSADVVADLHQLLEKAGEKSPYLLVGHSFGGLHVRLFAHEYPDAVIGVVLVDAVHEEWWSQAAAQLPPPSPTDSPQLQSFRQFITVDYADPAKTAEGMDIPATVAQLQNANALGATPLLVLVAGVPMLPATGLPAPLPAQLNDLLQQTLPKALIHLSSQSLRISVDNSGHNIPEEQPNTVVAAIRAIIDVACGKGC